MKIFLLVALFGSMGPIAVAQSTGYSISAEILAERRLLAENALRERLTPRETCTEVPGKLTRTGGGCKLSANGIVYGPSEWVGNRLRLEMWVNRNGAIQRCASSSRGGFHNWRFATAAEVLAAADYLNAMGIDPYLFTWSSETWDTRETHVVTSARAELEREEVVASNSEIVGYDTSDDYYPFDPQRYSHSTPVIGRTITTISESDHVVTGEFDFIVRHSLLVRAVIGSVLDLKHYTPSEVRGTLTWRRRQKVDSPRVSQQEYDEYLGQSWGTRTREVGRNIVVTDLGTSSRTVDARSYGLEVATPADVTADQIGLFCVRDDE